MKVGESSISIIIIYYRAHAPRCNNSQSTATESLLAVVANGSSLYMGLWAARRGSSELVG